VCGRRARGYDRGEGARRWRALDLGSTRAYLEAEAPRVECRQHGVVVARTAWARHGSRFTKAFEQQVAWLATHCSKSAICELMRISWPTVGRIIARVVADERLRRGDPLDGLTRIGIDELSFRKGQRYITVVVDHDTGRLVWAAEGRDKQTVIAFFEQLGEERAARIRLVSSDLGEWITRAVLECCPQATLCLDPYHVVALASNALDEVRREVWQQARRAGDTTGARWLKGARWALWKRPERLTERQHAKLATIEHVNRRLYRAYLLKEQLRLVFHSTPEEAVELLEAWLVWARRSRIPSFVKLAKTIKDHHAGIVATLTHRLSNVRIEAIKPPCA
jgi:transposase